MKNAEEPWKILQWDDLERDAQNSRVAYRFRAVVLAHAKSEQLGLLDGEWNSEIRRIIETIRNKVVHYCHNPSKEEALRAVRAFRQLEEEEEIDFEPATSTPKPPATDYTTQQTTSDVIRVYELANELKLRIDELINLASDCNIFLRNHMSSLTSAQVKIIRCRISQEGQKNH